MSETDQGQHHMLASILDACNGQQVDACLNALGEALGRILKALPEPDRAFACCKLIQCLAQDLARDLAEADDAQPMVH